MNCQILIPDGATDNALLLLSIGGGRSGTGGGGGPRRREYVSDCVLQRMRDVYCRNLLI